MNKLLMTVASLAIVAAPLAASAQSFDHNRSGGGNNHASGERQAGQDHGRNGGGYDYGRGHGWNDRNDGGALAAGVAGLFLGAALSNAQSYDYGQSYGYSQPYGYDQGYDCGWRTEAFRGPYGRVEYRQVNTCR